ncbi:Ionotropic glutamate receptor [Trinorchestia longiramus]|nr:Ionotropic glutamate receptor [Trinorchestia longiramus]
MKAGSPFGSPWTRYTEEFSLISWVVLVACIVASILVLVFVMRSSPREAVVWGLGEASISLGGLFASQGCSQVPVNTSSRTLLLTFLMMSVLVQAHYSAFLYAKLSDLRFTIPFRTISDILDDGSYLFGVWANTATDDEMKTTKDPLLQRLYQEHTLPGGLFLDNDEALKRMEKEKFLAVVSEVSMIQLTMNKPCRFIKLPIRLFSFPNGFAVRKGSPLKKIFDNAILKTLNTGVLSNYRLRWKLRSASCNNVDRISINLEQTMSAFCVLVLGIVVAFIVLISECIKHHG